MHWIDEGIRQHQFDQQVRIVGLKPVHQVADVQPAERLQRIDSAFYEDVAD